MPLQKHNNSPKTNQKGTCSLFKTEPTITNVQKFSFIPGCDQDVRMALAHVANLLLLV